MNFQEFHEQWVKEQAAKPEKTIECNICHKTMYFSKRCGAYVCNKCRNHRVNENQSLSRCFCGWKVQHSYKYRA